jgi:superfamily II DNA/RNA helicase
MKLTGVLDFVFVYFAPIGFRSNPSTVIFFYRMFDMGFEPQIKMIMQNIRPDRQTVLFSATFPKQIEKLAKSVLKFPLEIVVGERSTVNKDITQWVEVREEEDKFLRLLQLLGIWYEKGSVLVFVDKQEKCDQLFQDLLKLGYPCLSLHGGKDQVSFFLKKLEYAGWRHMCAIAFMFRFP